MASSHARIDAFLAAKFPKNAIAPAHYGELLAPYALSGLAPPHMLSELETGDDGKFWSIVWEAMLYRHFTDLGFALRNHSNATGQNGPDFSFSRLGKTIWVEAVVPSPEGIPADYLEPPVAGEFRVKSKPDHQRVLRCTSAIADKKIKFGEYVAKGIVQEADCAVIAVNICRLSDWDVDGNGISQLPLALEAVFPVGPLAVPITPQGTLAGAAQHIPRFAVRKTSGIDIQTANFLDPTYGGISAVLQGHQKDVYNKPLVLDVIHNPLARNPLQTGLFDAYKEFVAVETGDDYQLRNVAPQR
jgi:hypothetical protein